jgi:preflagellin peptidase FlaK
MTNRMVEIFSVTRIAVGLAILSAAALSDWRTRQVSNIAWILMGSLGMVLLAVEMSISENFEPIHFLIFVPIAILFFDVFWDREPVFENGISLLPILLYIVALVSVIALVLIGGFTKEVAQLLTIPGMILIAEVFFYTRLLHGGADAKALMSLAILFPVYPLIEGLPLISYPIQLVENLQIVFPFAFLLLMNAAILQVVTVPLGLFLKNLVTKDFGFPEMFLGYRMDIRNIPKRFVWPMEVVRDNEIVLMVFPKRGGNVKEELIQLRKRGVERIWVTPKVPFLIPMLLGLIFSFVVGNIIIFFL